MVSKNPNQLGILFFVASGNIKYSSKKKFSLVFNKTCLHFWSLFHPYFLHIHLHDILCWRVTVLRIWCISRGSESKILILPLRLVQIPSDWLQFQIKNKTPLSKPWSIIFKSDRKWLNNLQSDQINMAVLFWYLVKSDASVRYCTVAVTGQVTFYKVPEQNGQV